MKRILYIILGVFVVIILSLFAIYDWHQYEHAQEVWYGKNTFEIMLEAGENKIKYNWTDSQATDYYYKKCDSLNLVPPRKCPYCYYKSLTE